MPDAAVVKKTDRTSRGKDEVLSLEVAAARLYNSGKFETRAAAEAALLTGQPIATYFWIYQLAR